MSFMEKTWAILERWAIALMAPPTPMEPTPLNPSKSTPTPQMVQTPTPAPKTPVEASQPQETPFTVIPWDTPKHNWHNFRVLCDLANLTLDEKNLLCACVYQESQFNNFLPSGSPVTHANLVNYKLVSTDWGLCQINDYWHVRKYPDFPSATYIMDNPDKASNFMIDCYKNGLLKQWVSFSSGAYLKWLEPTSPMWGLAINS